MGVTTILNFESKSQDILQSYFFFIHEGAVSQHQREKDLDNVSICEVLDPEPLVPIDPLNRARGDDSGEVEATELVEIIRRDIASTVKKITNAAARDVAEREFAKRYSDKLYKVRGVVGNLSDDKFGGHNLYVVQLVTNHNKQFPEGKLHCHFNADDAEQLAKIRVGQTVIVQGRCFGLKLNSQSIDLRGCRLLNE
jgi:hypothetical protein